MTTPRHSPLLAVALAAGFVGLAGCRAYPPPGSAHGHLIQVALVSLRHAPSLEGRLVADTIARVIAQGAADRAFPGAIAVVGRRSGVVAVASAGAAPTRHHGHSGHRNAWPTSRCATPRRRKPGCSPTRSRG